MIKFIQSVTENELRFISNLDYGCDAGLHYEALKLVIFEQNCLSKHEQIWYPDEVIELGANWLQPGHEREFTICTLLVIHNVLVGGDDRHDLAYKFENHATDYDQLPEEQRALVLSSFEQANI